MERILLVVPDSFYACESCTFRMGDLNSLLHMVPASNFRYPLVWYCEKYWHVMSYPTLSHQEPNPIMMSNDVHSHERFGHVSMNYESSIPWVCSCRQSGPWIAVFLPDKRNLEVVPSQMNWSIEEGHAYGGLVTPWTNAPDLRLWRVIWIKLSSSINLD